MAFQSSAARDVSAESKLAARVANSDGTLEARGISRRFGPKQALAPTDLSVGPGGVTGLLGPNGSGKSTLLRILVGLVRPDTGRVAVDGVELRGDGMRVRMRCSYAPGEVALYGEMRGGEHLDWLLRGRDRAARLRARAISSELGLPLAQRVRGYSHGMKRQLLFSAALAPEVRVRILDEPSEGLDPSKRSQVLDLMRADAARGRTILLSSHHLGEVDRICDHLVFMNAGAKLADERSETFAARARRFVHLRFAEGSDMDAVRIALEVLSGAPVAIAKTRATVRLPSDDPREFLARACASRDLPAIAAIEYGALSLPDLYRELYGVEVC